MNPSQSFEIDHLGLCTRSFYVAKRTASPKSCPTQQGAIFAGAFNPVHDGHRAIARMAAEKLDRPVWLELSVANVDKQVLDESKVRDRIHSIQKMTEDLSVGIVVTQAATFVAKAKLFPGTVFVVGADTVERINHPKYYQGCERLRNSSIAQLREQDCRFLVFGRDDGIGFRSEDVLIDPTLRSICQFVPQSEFAMNVSSTQLRVNGRNDANG